MLSEDIKHLIIQCRQIVASKIHNRLRADIAGHDDDRVGEIDCPPLAIGQAAVVEYLQKYIEDVGVSLLDFVKQHHAVGAAAHRFGELAALVVTDVAWRRTNQAGHGVALHIFTHIDADHSVFVVE